MACLGARGPLDPALYAAIADSQLGLWVKVVKPGLIYRVRHLRINFMWTLLSTALS